MLLPSFNSGVKVSEIAVRTSTRVSVCCRTSITIRVVRRWMAKFTWRWSTAVRLTRSRCWSATRPDFSWLWSTVESLYRYVQTSICTGLLWPGAIIHTHTHNTHAHTHTHTHTRLTALFRDYVGGLVPERSNQSEFYWSKRQWVAAASAGPYASLHLAPDR